MSLQISEKGKEMLAYQERLAKEYGYKPIPIHLFNGNVRDKFEQELPEWCKTEPNSINLYSADGTLLCEGYARIVIGDYGAFVEISPEQIKKDNLMCKRGEEYRIYDPKYSLNVKYHWLTAKDASDCKVYFQQKTVRYADYRPGMYYISPYEVFLEKDFELNISSKQKEIRLIIAGSRGFNDYDLLESETTALISLVKDKFDSDHIIKIVSGTAKGPDQLGERYGARHNYPVIRFPADWNTHGKRAGYLRNDEMAKFAKRADAGILLAFWDGESRGTKHMINLAHKYGIEVHVVHYGRDKMNNSQNTINTIPNNYVLTPRESVSAWGTVVTCYRESIEKNSPPDTMQMIIDKLGLEATKEVFATVSAIKKNDGRIYGGNREYMNEIPVNPALTVWDHSNPMLGENLDAIHTAHINNLISELRSFEKTIQKEAEHELT